MMDRKMLVGLVLTGVATVLELAELGLAIVGLLWVVGVLS